MAMTLGELTPSSNILKTTLCSHFLGAVIHRNGTDLRVAQLFCRTQQARRCGRSNSAVWEKIHVISYSRLKTNSGVGRNSGPSIQAATTGMGFIAFSPLLSPMRKLSGRKWREGA